MKEECYICRKCGSHNWHSTNAVECCQDQSSIDGFFGRRRICKFCKTPTSFDVEMHEHKLRPSYNPIARLMGDKWVCKLCGRYFNYDGMLAQQKTKQVSSEEGA